MIPKILSLSTLWVFAGAHGKGELGSVGHGLIGYGIEMWQPVCAFACRDVLSSSRLRCSTMSHEDKTKRHNDSTAYETSTECFAENKPYLLTLAQCLHERCDGRAEHWELVRFWTTDATFSVQHRPVFDFEEALRSAQNRSGSLPVAELHGTLAIASRISDHDWNFSFEGLNNYVYVEKRHSLHGILLISLLILIPIAVHLARLARLPTLLERKTAAVLTHSALLGQRHAVPLPYDLGILPTRGQAIFITSIITLNVCLLFKGYRIANPDVFNRFPAHLANRAGVLSLANLTLMMLCSSRNNLAVRFTKWSYSTMLLYHRWIAYVCVGEALMHGTIYFILHIPYLARKFTQAYWNLGVISVGLMCMAVPLSSLPVRKRAYELFIDSHILLSVVILAGYYYHIHLEFRGSRGYESWICLAAFLWVGDRVMRLVKLLSNGIKTAAITYIDEEYARIDIPGVKASGHAYLYFPGLSWRLWQNHPFSIAASVHEFSVCGQHSYERASAGEGAGSEHQQPLLAAENVSQTHRHKLKPSSSSSSLASLLGESSDRSSAIELEKLPQHSKPQVQNHSRSHQITGLIFYIRRQRGMTVKLFETTSQTLKVLIEGPYRPLPIPNIATCATLVCIAGGVGISTALPVLTSHALIGRSVLYWGCRSQGLVDAVDLDGLQRAGVEIHVKVRSRWEVRGIVTEEAQMGLSRGDVIVLTSGPNEMADDVRAAVVAANLTAAHPGRRRIRLVEESFSW